MDYRRRVAVTAMSVKIYPKPNGKYLIIARWHGKRKETTVPSRAIANAVKAKLDKEIALQRMGVKKTLTTPLFRDVAKRWLGFIHLRRSPATHKRYSGLLTKINKHIGKIPIDKISRGDVRDMLLKEHKKGASKSAIELMHTVCSGVFQFAIDDELITTNPAHLILKRLDLKRDRKEIYPLTAEEMDLALSHVSDRYYPLFLLLYHTGCRIGEALALEWADINLTGKKVRISKTAKDQTVKQSTKTYTVRTIPISDELLSVLESMRKKDKMLCFRQQLPQRLVYHDKGRLLSDNTIRRHWSNACRKARIGHRRIHDIRHTCASLHLSRGSGIERVSYLLGHTSPKITWDVYSHYLPSEDNGFINNLSDSTIRSDKQRIRHH